MLILAGFIYASGFLSQCGPAVVPSTTRAIIQVESAGNALAIGDNRLKRSFNPRTRTEAVNLAAYLINQGHSVDLGLMQINSSHLASMKLSLVDVFDPCRNIRAGTTILSDCYRRHDNGDPIISLFKALSAYNTGRAWRGSGYINRILQAAGVSYRVKLLTGKPPQEEKKKPTQPAESSTLFFGEGESVFFGREAI